MNDPMKIDDREDRLPKWAQEQLRLLRRRVSTAENLSEELRLATDPNESDTVLDPVIHELIGLGSGSYILFRFRNGYELRGRMVHDREGFSYLEVMGGGSGHSRQMMIAPRSSNVVRIYGLDV